ncbi:zinc finger translocation-associated protein isoform X2 [Mugil cephalus]|uniref:zinc finger translocation-associated protein isoform X2 n=1 Tax=Mugil cephalus TaxID=48193 RepID=UPI001FB70D94|nr:zinc finger translocation-associated protein isoform X2 [Mugil cephalus]
MRVGRRERVPAAVKCTDPRREGEEEEEEEEEEGGGGIRLKQRRPGPGPGPGPGSGPGPGPGPGPVMEERDSEAQSEPVDLRCAEQPELLSLIISGEEEATQEESDLGEEDGVANGHGEEESEAGLVTPARSPATSYWSITEGPDQPLLISPAPGPSARKPRVQRASRPGLSRIPGRDHRRYYHEYWRSEYLMDFDPQRHGMICMVCGSSLATLKLSTIKRHIRQKHPDSLLWSAADKEVIRSGWESHLSLGGGQRSYGPAAGPSVQDGDEMMHLSQHAAEAPDPVTPQEQTQPPPSKSPHSVEGEAPEPREEEEEEEEDDDHDHDHDHDNDLPGPSAQTLERYLNDSLHAWFRQEFLMEYEAEAGRLLCMVCGAELPSLHLDHIKSHVLDTHPNSLVFSSEEKHCILQAWAQTHEESENVIKPEPDTKDGALDLFAGDMETIQIKTDLYPESDGTLTQDTCLIGEDGGVGAPQQGPPPVRQPRKRRLRGGDPWRLRLDYLVAYGPRGQGTFCMVCSQVLHETKVSSFRRHIQERHPETTALSRQDREAMAAAWTKDNSSDGTRIQDEINLGEADVLNTSGGMNNHAAPDLNAAGKAVKLEEGVSGGKGKSRDGSGGGGAATPSRHGHYPGKDQRRNYQVRWRMEYLMDYDCRRHGLICMVCGATLATLKVSTIKRHIQQVHPHSLFYSPEDKQQALLSYNQTALHFIHSDDCFSSQDHGHSELAPPPAHFGT